MNTNDNLEDDFTRFSLSPESRDYLSSSAKWAKIIGIFTLVLIGFAVLGALAFVVMGGFIFESVMGNSTMEVIMVLYVVLFLFITLIGCIPFYFLYKFATETNANLIEFKGVPLVKGITYLKSFFKSIVLLTLTIIAFYIIALIVVINYTGY
jgi:hypothetical protein